METEAKFIVPDKATFDRLRDAEKFGPYTRHEPKEKVKQVHDRYVDTADRRFFNHQYAVRLREGKEGVAPLLTIKGLGAETEGAIHSREEHQVEVPNLEMSEWPAGDVKRIAEQIAGDLPLGDLVNIDQVRNVSILYQGERKVAECSLDEVTIAGGGGPGAGFRDGDRASARRYGF